MAESERKAMGRERDGEFRRETREEKQTEGKGL
jgi:hypothetical protein